MNPWKLPTSADIGGVQYEINTDYRDVLEIVQYLNDDQMPDFMRWQIAIGLFYEGDIPDEHFQEAAQYIADFISYGEQGKPGPKLLDWEQDAKMIIADVNKTAGQEIRSLPYLHWWSFMSYFHAIGEGQLSTVVSIRKKLKEKKKLEKWEKDYYRSNKEQIDLKKKISPQQQAEIDRLNALLG